VLDTSAGFGSRMGATLLAGNNYCGIDPNKKLFAKLKENYFFYKENELISKKQKCGLYCQGSEIFIPELQNKFDVSFTSPPYFNLETYSQDDGQSIKKFSDYDKWVKFFVVPTVQNTYKYLKTGGYAMINIKNLNKKYPLYDDFYSAFKNVGGFEFVEVFDMQIKTKKNYGMGTKCDIPDKEPVMVFRKVQ
jgi:DNA modification methylase